VNAWLNQQLERNFTDIIGDLSQEDMLSSLPEDIRKLSVFEDRKVCLPLTASLFSILNTSLLFACVGDAFVSKGS